MLRRINIVDVDNAELIFDGDELRNINSFEYLRLIADKIILNNPKDYPTIDIYTPGLCAPPVKTQEFSYDLKPYQVFQDLKNIFECHKHDEENNLIYESNRAYGDIYTWFLESLETEVGEIENHRNDMLNRCIYLALKNKQISYSIKLLDEKITRLQSDIEYYKRNSQFIELTSINNLREDLFNLQKRRRRLDKNIEINEELIKAINQFLSDFDKIIDRVYANPNFALERSANMIESALENVSQTSSIIEESVTERLKGKSESKIEKLLNTINYYLAFRDVNETTPQAAGSLYDCLISQISPTFKPLKKTSMPCIRNYKYKEAKQVEEGVGLFRYLSIEDGEVKSSSYPIEYRMGTQAQYHEGEARVSPIFEAWLRVQKRKRKALEQVFGKQEGQTRITHIYFNNLPIDRENYVGEREVKLTHQLLALEKSHDNVAIITLPADQAIMDSHFYAHHEKKVSLKEAFNKMFKIALGNSTEKVKDFYISDDIKKLLYGDGEPYNKANETEELAKLLANSFYALGFVKDEQLSEADLIENLSEAELQAVYFHFIKFELTDFIITKLRPDSFNMSCKDGIDRAGVSSAYYNLMKSIKDGSPLSEKDFIRALHGAPTLVKGRAMNHHTRLIWNAIDAYINAAQRGQENKVPSWLINWRNENAPPQTKQYYINELTIFIDKLERNNELANVSIFKSNSLPTAKKIKALLESNGSVANMQTKNNANNLNSDQLLPGEDYSKLTNYTFELTVNDKELMEICAGIEKDNLFDFRPFRMEQMVNNSCSTVIGF